MCSERRDKSFHSHIQPALSLDVSLHGGIPPGRPTDWEINKYLSQHDAALIYLAHEGALRYHDIALRVWGRLQEEGDIIPTFSSPTLISDSVLWEEKQEKDRNLPREEAREGDFKEERNHMI